MPLKTSKSKSKTKKIISKQAQKQKKKEPKKMYAVNLDNLRRRDTEWYGWVPDLPDHRDLTYTIPEHIDNQPLPPKVDLTDKCPVIYDQGQLGSCTANAIGAAMEFDLLKQNQKMDFIPSRLFIYYNERVIENSVSEDSGAMIRDGIKSVARQGVCPEPEWPYEINKFTDRPSLKCYRDAKKFQALKYRRLNNAGNPYMLKACLASGTPFIFGFTVYESFESDEVAKTGTVQMPNTNENELGGHAVLCVGYDDNTERFIVRNSWGADWGTDGYFTMPYSYVTNTNLADDFWAISVVEDPTAGKQTEPEQQEQEQKPQTELERISNLLTD